MRLYRSQIDLPEPSSSEGFSVKRWSQRKLAAARAERVAPPEPEPPVALPPLDSLTFESDYTPFMRLEVGDPLRRDALRKLLRDPRFNVMDGLDVYIDDYSIADPIEPAVVRTLAQARFLLEQADAPDVQAEAASQEKDESSVRDESSGPPDCSELDE